MNVIYQDQAGKWQQGSLIPHPSIAGYQILIKADGKQFSMQPGGVDGERDPAAGGGNGPWEAVKISGLVGVWTTGDGNESYPRGVVAR